MSFSGFYFFQTEYTGPDRRSNVQDFTAAGFKKFYDMHSAFVDADCKDALEPWMCQQANYSSPYIQTPIFVAQALTDGSVMPNHGGVQDQPTSWGPEMSAYAQEWHDNMTRGLNNFLTGPGPRGLFAPSCYDHCGIRIGAPRIQGIDVMDAMHTWLARVLNGSAEEGQVMDDCKGLMCNPTCPNPEPTICCPPSCTTELPYIDHIYDGSIDGKIGKNTATALQQFLHAEGFKPDMDGKWDYGKSGSPTTMALQEFLNSATSYNLTVDGQLGHDSTCALQTYLQDMGFTPGVYSSTVFTPDEVDGDFGTHTRKGLQSFLRSLPVCPSLMV
jgi:hypothetical protein